MFFYFCLIILYIPLLIVLPTRVTGKKNLPKKGRVIFCTNHQTLCDPVIIAYKLTGRRFRFMAKKPLFKHKISGAFLKGIGAYPVDYKAATDIKAVKQTIKYLKEEKAVCIFPEGGRRDSDINNELKNGVAMFALRTNTPVVPACFVKKPGFFKLNRLIVGKPIYLHEMEQFKDKKADKELLDQASDIINHGIFDLKTEYENKKKSKKNRK